MRTFTQEEVDKSLIEHQLGLDTRWAQGQVANFEKADLTSINFEKKNLQAVNFQGANLQGVDFQGANLQGVDLQDANLQGANLRNTDLRSANLKNADFRGTKKLGMKVRWRDLQGAIDIALFLRFIGKKIFFVLLIIIAITIVLSYLGVW